MTRDERVSNGAPAPLFDRLVDVRPHEPVEVHPRRWFTEQEFADSIRDELTRLLNTRTDIARERWERGPLTVVDYGIPDFTGWFKGSDADMRRLADDIRRAILAFEPRLQEPDVAVDRSYPQDSTVYLSIRGHIRIGKERIPVAFPIAVDRAPATGREGP